MTFEPRTKRSLWVPGLMAIGVDVDQPAADKLVEDELHLARVGE